MLLEMLPGGRLSIEQVAQELALSKRTLQRRLKDIGTSFQEELSVVRKELALHYLEHSRVSNTEIAYLLGYDDPNSFFRAFQAWNGTTPESVRSQLY